jgi:cob(I)alamin adenosyltransferase
MAERSHVTSIDAIESFRAALIVYLSKARPTIEEVSNELTRMRVWLETDQRTRWEKEIRSLTLKLEQAQQELFAARLSKLQTASVVQELAVQRLRRRLREAEEKLETTRKWGRALEDRTDPLVKEIENLHSFLTIDMTRAAAHLDQVVKALEAYASVAQPGPASPAAAAPPEDKPA